MKTKMRLRRLAKMLAPAGMLLTSYLPMAHAETIHRVSPDNGFFETFDAWVPARVPDLPTDKVIFGQQAQSGLALLQDHTVGDLLFANQTNIEFSVPGGSASDLTRIMHTLTAETGRVDNATLRLGNSTFTGVNDAYINITDTFDVDGELHVADGGRFHSHYLNLGTQQAMQTQASVSGGDVVNGRSRLSSTSLHVGNRSQASLDVTLGAELRTHVAWVGRNTSTNTDNVSRVLIHGADNNGVASTWNTAAIAVGSKGAGRVTAASGGRVNTDSIALGTGPSNEPEDRGLGLAEIVGHDQFGTPSTFDTNLAVVGVRGTGYLSVLDGGQFESREVLLARTQGSTGHLLMHAQDNRPVSRWTNEGDIAVGGDLESQGGTGTLELRQRSHAQIDGDIKVWPGSSVLVDGGTLSAERVEVDPTGRLSLTDGTLEISEYEGTTLVQLGGRIAPGPGTGRTSFLSDLHQRGGATTAMEIGGREAGETFDRLSVDATAIVDGVLDMTIVNNFVPRRDDLFNIVYANELLGSYQNALNGQRVPTSDGKGSFVVNYGHLSSYDQNEVVLSDFRSRVLGDYNLDGETTAADIDLLSAGVRLDDIEFDLNEDGKVDGDDRTFWVEDVVKSYYGDSNLDGEFNSTDFIHVFQSNKYEDGIPSNTGWSEGDWNGDGEFDTADFVFAFRANGYEMGRRTGVAAVPEPNGSLLAAIGLGVVGFIRRRR